MRLESSGGVLRPPCPRGYPRPFALPQDSQAYTYQEDSFVRSLRPQFLEIVDELPVFDFRYACHDVVDRALSKLVRYEDVKRNPRFQFRRNMAVERHVHAPRFPPEKI